MNPGILLGIGAYLVWGLLPLFWKLLQNVPASEILCHRMVWSFAFFLILLIVGKSWKWLSVLKSNPKIILQYALCAVLISFNWFIYIWSVLNGHVVEASLGYFINPLMAVLLGVIFLKEKLRMAQLGAIILAFIGVLYLTVIFGSLPWRGLILALSFSIYGLTKKKVPLKSREGMSLETAIQFLPALLYILWLAHQNTTHFTTSDPGTMLLLILSGVVTGFPLYLFASAASKINLSQLGILQYISPTLQLLIGTLIHGEAFPRNKLIGFIFVWIAVILYTTENIRSYQREREISKGRK
ncbi:MAG: EamA family transporter RarD [Candidatus Cloacimonetes bacterium]|nr:EamA family transporter RarD [Candidatus Cloacimonadota bacterium]